MNAEIIDGKALANRLRTELTAQIAWEGLQPGLAVILVGHDPASEIYVGNKIKACEKAGITSFEHRLPANVAQADVLYLIKTLNEDPAVHGILLQLPLPAHLESHVCLEAIDPSKDADGLHSQNLGRLMGIEKGPVPCTPQGCLQLIKSVETNLSGLNALVIGTSRLVGRPMGLLLLNEECTVTYAHIQTRNVPELARQADILVVATGVPGLVKGDWVKEGAVVIDVGITRGADGKITGDVDFEAARLKARAITPVPGGVGPMTIYCLLKNTVDSARRAQGRTV